MGRRHQIFVVARVCVAPGERRQYRCVAAIHHQSCYERLPLEAVNSFKHLVRVPANATLVEEELATYCQRNAGETSYPCPYTSFLAETAFNIDLMRPGRPYLSNSAVPLDAHMGSTRGDNNDGLTMVDVTTPLNPSYCFVWIDRWGPLPIRTPLRAAQYLRSYSPAQESRSEIGDPEEEFLNLGAIANLDDMPLIPKRTLGLVWPWEYGRFKDEELSSPLESSLNSPNDLDVLRSQVSLSPEDVALLAKATREDLDLGDVVDLSRYPLTSSQLFLILGELGTFRRLDISYNQEVNKEVFTNILETFPDVSWINVMHCPISRNDLVELASTEPQIFRSIGGIIHPAFFLSTNKDWWDNPPPFKAIDFPTAFRLGVITSLDFEFIYLPFFRMDELVQNLTDLVELAQRHINNSTWYGSVHSSILASALRTAPGQGWQDRHIQLVPGSLRAGKYEPLKGCYEFLVRVSECWEPKILRYGAFPPLSPGKIGHTESDLMEVEEFLERLKEDGARPPSDGVAVERLVELCSKMKKLSMENLEKKW